MGAVDLPRLPLAVKFLYVAIVPANACQMYTKFQLPSSTSFRDKEGVLKFNVGATAPTLNFRQAFAGTMATYKNLTDRGRLGRSAAPTFYLGTPSIPP